jgi:hypothetical protein
MATRILSTIGVAFNLTLYLATLCVPAFSFRRLKQPNSTADRYGNGHGMSFGLEDQKPQPKAPQLPAGAFLSGCLEFAAAIFRSKMETPKKRQKYTAKHISEIIDRITALRMHWLRHVETQLASQQRRPVLDQYKLSPETAE